MAFNSFDCCAKWQDDLTSEKYQTEAQVFTVRFLVLIQLTVFLL
jgi:hypothetical protein